MAMAAGSILIIDDDAAVARALSLILTRAGYRVRSETSGRRGVQLLDEGGIDLVLTDIIMPDLDGIEAIRRIRAYHPGLRIVAMSGGGRIDKADFLQMAQALGADGVIEKPVRREHLLEIVDRAMANPARRLPEPKERS